MSGTAVDPEKVIARLAQQVGAMAAEVAMRDVALEAALERAERAEAQLEQRTSELPSPELDNPGR